MNTAKDHLRKKRWANFMQWKDQKKMDNFFEQIENPRIKADSPVLNQELNTRITDEIQKLPEKQQWVFILRFIENFSVAEIVEATGLAEGTVKSTLHFAVKKFAGGIYGQS